MWTRASSANVHPSPFFTVCREDFSQEPKSDRVVRWDSYADFNAVTDGEFDIDVYT